MDHHYRPRGLCGSARASLFISPTWLYAECSLGSYNSVHLSVQSVTKFICEKSLSNIVVEKSCTNLTLSICWREVLCNQKFWLKVVCLFETYCSTYWAELHVKNRLWLIGSCHSSTSIQSPCIVYLYLDWRNYGCISCVKTRCPLADQRMKAVCLSWSWYGSNTVAVAGYSEMMTIMLISFDLMTMVWTLHQVLQYYLHLLTRALSTANVVWLIVSSPTISASVSNTLFSILSPLHV